MAKRRDEGSGRLFLGSPFCFCAGIGSMHLGEPTDPSPLRKGRGRSVRERGAVGVLTRGQFVWPADWKSAIQQVEKPALRESDRASGSGRARCRFCACIGTMSLDEPTDPSPRPSPLRKGRGRSVRERGAVGVLTRGQFVWPADWKSAIQRIENVENLRYGSWTARSVHGEPVFAFAHAMGP